MKKVLKGAGITVLVAVTTGLSLIAGLALAKVWTLSQVISVESVSKYTPEVRDPVDLNAGMPLNYVIIGSDSRIGDNGAIGGVDYDADGNIDTTMRSDTAIVVHVSADRSRIDAISIPRDSMVSIPACIDSIGDTSDPEDIAQFNAAFSKGDTVGSAATCTLRTIEDNTGLHIDGYAVLDFQGFQGVIDAIGGVKMNIPYDMVAEKADLDLKAGEQVLNGQQALGFARARTFEVGESTGSDLERIERQQQLLTSVADQVMSLGTLTNPKKVVPMIESVLENTTVSEELADIPALTGFLLSLKNISSESINFYTIPNEPWIEDPNRVIWTDAAQSMWDSMKTDTPIADPIAE